MEVKKSSFLDFGGYYASPAPARLSGADHSAPETMVNKECLASRTKVGQSPSKALVKKKNFEVDDDDMYL